MAFLPPTGRLGHRAVIEVGLGGRVLGGALEHHRGGNVDITLDPLVHGRPRDRAGERVVDLGEGERELVEVGDPADDRRQVDYVAATERGSPSDIQIA